MANIAVINYCNLSCPYCFANKFITEEEKQLITDEQLINILNFLEKSGRIEHIGLIGGEPTLHPNFENILKICIERVIKKNHGTITTFSNGILLGKYAKYFDKVQALVNLNNPITTGEKAWAEIEKSFKHLRACNVLNNISIGINLYPNMPDFSYIFDFAHRFGFTEIRCSYVAPTCQFSKADKIKYYSEAKPLYLEFLKQLDKNDLKINLDCNHIPDCFFTDDELALQSKVVIRPGAAICNPVNHISPDMQATCCFGAYHLIDLTQFESLNEAERYFLFNEIYPRTLRNGINNKCADCKKFKNFSCQGGCLAFANT